MVAGRQSAVSIKKVTLVGRLSAAAPRAASRARSGADLLGCFTRPVCLEVSEEPVQLPCGHVLSRRKGPHLRGQVPELDLGQCPGAPNLPLVWRVC
uniref:Uncharacterized protein n=1 Tax=Balaenoptera musculus TaxID=9771 RepID=A0A8C0CBC0_BALMU